ncbi:hypothetical protein E4T47_05067 [Aureobasidium subglaciale]|nr:hypothetical protein E4T47_05067 [Aureobasidium subglaciale]
MPLHLLILQRANANSNYHNVPRNQALHPVIRVDVAITNLNSQSGFSGYSSTCPRSAAELLNHFNAFISTYRIRLISLNLTESTLVAVVSTDLGWANLQAPFLPLDVHNKFNTRYHK